MAIRPILVVGNPVLRQKAKRVPRIDRSIEELVDDMVETMRDAPGVGLAAPQIGVSLRIAVIEVDHKVTVLINPEIIKLKGECEPEEGCLSVPGYWGCAKRAESVVVKARDLGGRDFRVQGEGLFGQALQHEIDHLNGILYIDHIADPDKLRPVEPRAERERARAAGRARSD
ncbi:MAG: peptide deformylase [Chloroflexi bacterium]|nr:peptide deformylase [Chloroflexota bacterium]